MVECGTLGVLHIKELLKNDAKQLNESTLRISFYNEGILSHLFLPSPEVLRYSQVSAYNNILAAILTFDREKIIIDVGHGDKKRRLVVTTLRSKLLESIAAAKVNGNLALAIENQNILDELPNFSNRWLRIIMNPRKNVSACREMKIIIYYIEQRKWKK